MRIALVLAPEAAPAAGPDLTRYFFVCASVIAVLLAVLWVFRRFVAERLKVRAAKRSLQVLDVLPLSGKQKLVVVRCYDRSFLLGVGEKEVRAIAELDAEVTAARAGVPGATNPASAPRFAEALANELVVTPEKSPARSRVAMPAADVGGGILA